MRATSAACERDWRVVATFPHDTRSFTQGLVQVDGRLFESTGGYGDSAVIEVDPASGQRLRQHALDRRLFGEGLSVINGHLIQLTWHAGIAFAYDLDLRLIGTKRYAGQGWGLTRWQQAGEDVLLMSDGSSYLRFLHREDMSLLRRLAVHEFGRPVTLINELEIFEDQLLANIWRQDRIAQIDLGSGEVTAWIDLSPLRRQLSWPRGEPRETDLNGIAVSADGQHLLVTGKRWPRLFEIALEPCSAGSDQQ